MSTAKNTAKNATATNAAKQAFTLATMADLYKYTGASVARERGNLGKLTDGTRVMHLINACTGRNTPASAKLFMGLTGCHFDASGNHKKCMTIDKAGVPVLSGMPYCEKGYTSLYTGDKSNGHYSDMTGKTIADSVARVDVNEAIERFNVHGAWLASIGRMESFVPATREAFDNHLAMVIEKLG